LTENWKCDHIAKAIPNLLSDFYWQLALILSLGQELSDKPFSLLSTNRASLAHGGPKGGPADDERHHQNLMQEVFL